MDTTQKKGFNFKWLLLLMGLGLLLYLFYFKKNKTPVDRDIISRTESNEGTEGSEEIPSGFISKPQYSEQNPRPESLDPFTLNVDFERMMIGNDNKTDFDFSFDNQKKAPTYTLNNDTIDFELMGTLRTRLELDNKIPLALEIYTNDQISLTKRKERYTYNLPFIKETEKKDSRDKILYRFDFKQSMQLESGLHYFLIVPVGRNRILYTGKFFAK